MVFINEKISETDIEKHGLRKINAREFIADGSYYWTVNTAENVYLRYLSYDHENPGEIRYSYCWKGALFNLRARSKGEGQRGGKGRTTWEYAALFPLSREAESALVNAREEVFADLKRALTAYGDFGVFSSYSEHTAYFSF